MKSLKLSQTGIYRLQQLAHHVKEKTGVRHKLSNPNEVINLLRYSSTCIDAPIYACYNEFIDAIDEEQRTYLQKRGILLPQITIGQQDKIPSAYQHLR